MGENRKFLILIIVNIVIIAGLIATGFLLHSKYLEIALQNPPIPEHPIVPILPEVSVQLERCLAGEENPPLEPNTHWPDAFYKIIESLSQKSEASCLKLDGEFEKNSCLKYFYLSSAITENDVKYCEKMKLLEGFTDPKCFALVKNDISYCEQVKNRLNKEICLAMFKPNSCDYLSGTFDIDDIDGLVVEIESRGIDNIQRTIKKIREIEEQKAITVCQKSVYFIKAIKDRNPTICDLPEIRGDVFTALICQILSVPDPEKKWQSLRQKICYEKFSPTMALLKNDPLYCEKIPFKDAHNQGLYSFCLEQIK